MKRLLITIALCLMMVGVTLASDCDCQNGTCPCESGEPCICVVCECADCPGKGWRGSICSGEQCQMYQWVPAEGEARSHWICLYVGGKYVGAYCSQRQQYYADPQQTGQGTPANAPAPLPRAWALKQTSRPVVRYLGGGGC